MKRPWVVPLPWYSRDRWGYGYYAETVEIGSRIVSSIKFVGWTCPQDPPRTRRPVTVGRRALEV